MRQAQHGLGNSATRRRKHTAEWICVLLLIGMCGVVNRALMTDWKPLATAAAIAICVLLMVVIVVGNIADNARFAREQAEEERGRIAYPADQDAERWDTSNEL